jgi:excisionase family DNA binding protein
MTEFLTSAEAARILNVTPARVRQMHSQGTLRALRTASGTRLFSRAAVDRLARERSRKRLARPEALPPPS